MPIVISVKQRLHFTGEAGQGFTSKSPNEGPHEAPDWIVSTADFRVHETAGTLILLSPKPVISVAEVFPPFSPDEDEKPAKAPTDPALAETESGSDSLGENEGEKKEFEGDLDKDNPPKLPEGDKPPEKEEPPVPELTPAQKAAATRKANKEAAAS